MKSPDNRPVRLAIIGAGNFARKAHVPSFLALRGTFDVVAVGSRTQASASALARQLPGPPATYDDIPALLAQEDIKAVDLILPIHLLPEYVAMALKAGKHVVSEKPLAPTVEAGKQLLRLYKKYSGQVWMVAENQRYEPAFVEAARIIQDGEIGRPLLVKWTVYAPITPDRPYYQTEWRRQQLYPGGFMLDGGVHHAAALRMVLGEIAEVSAVADHIRPDLPPPDTLAASLHFENGAIGTYFSTYVLPAPWRRTLDVVGEHGSLRVEATWLEVLRSDARQEQSYSGLESVQLELAAFGEAIRAGAPHRNTPGEALQDVALIEAMLASARTGQRLAPAQL